MKEQKNPRKPFIYYYMICLLYTSPQSITFERYRFAKFLEDRLLYGHIPYYLSLIHI